MEFQLTKDAVKAWLDEDPSLNTLKNQYSLDEIWGRIEDKESIRSDEKLYEALLDVMYATRPKGVL